MELQAVMEKRRSIRNYNPERKVTKEQLEELIKAASYAPSWKNLQTSRYYCVLSENAVKELKQEAAAAGMTVEEYAANDFISPKQQTTNKKATKKQPTL